MKDTYTENIIIGAGAAGLACAAQLNKKKRDYIILEKSNCVGIAWRNHYDRLHLHTNKSSSSLPYIKYSKNTPKYPSKKHVVAYLENYASAFEINPVFNTTVRRITKEDTVWKTETDNSSFHSKNIIICTGNTNQPKLISKPGLNSFPGEVQHSSSYKNGKDYKGKNVLVVGFGNSACEIALDLFEHGAKPSMSIRSAVNVIPRDIFGVPSLQLGIAQSRIPPRIADFINKPLLSLLVGNIEKYGLRKLPYGPTEQIVKYQKVPLLDIGTMKLIKNGSIKIFGDIKRVELDEIHFDNGQKSNFDGIVMGTGYRTGLSKWIQLEQERLDDIKLAIKKRQFFAKDHLYFCGFYVAPSGMLREISKESNIISESICNS